MKPLVHHRAPADLRRCEAGASAVEFALIAPVMLMLMMQIFNLGQMIYGKVLLGGAVEQAARTSALETANTSAADAQVRAIVGWVLAGATITGTRSSYFDFADIGRPERWNDVNGDGNCSGGWERDVGATGNGGAGDVVIYTVTAAYDPLFRVPFAPGSWRRTTLRAVAVRKNQPYASQTGYGSAAGTCA
jgi:hypothetical protein